MTSQGRNSVRGVMVSLALVLVLSCKSSQNSSSSQESKGNCRQIIVSILSIYIISPITSPPSTSSSVYGSGALRPVVGVSQHKFRGTVRPAGVHRRSLDQP